MIGQTSWERWWYMAEDEAQPVYIVTNRHHPFVGRSVVITTGPDEAGLVGVEELGAPWRSSLVMPTQLRRVTEHSGIRCAICGAWDASHARMQDHPPFALTFVCDRTECREAAVHAGYVSRAELTAPVVARLRELQKGTTTMATTIATGNIHIHHTKDEVPPACPQTYQIGDIVTDGSNTGRVTGTQLMYVLETIEGTRITRMESELVLAPQTEEDCWLSTAAYVGVLASEGYDNTAIRNKAYVYLGNLQKANGLKLLSTQTHEETRAKLLAITCQARAHIDWINQAIAQGT